MSRGPAVRAPIQKLTLPISAVPVTMTGATGVGFGTAVIGDFPEGNILILGAVLNYTLTEADDDISDTFDADIAIGSAPADDATLAGAEVDVIPSTTVPQAVASVATGRAASTPAECGGVIDNTDGSKELNVQVLIDDADIGADDVDVVLNGTLYLSYVVLGDD